MTRTVRLTTVLAGFVLSRAVLIWVILGHPVIRDTTLTYDVTTLYVKWYDILASGVFPIGDVSWQYPPGAALVVLAPGLLPFDYLHSFVVLTALADLVAFVLLLRAGRGNHAGAWLWTVGVLLIGPITYARYDLIVTVLAIAGLVLLARRPAAGGALLGLGAAIKAWPLLALVGTRPGTTTRRSWLSAVVTGAAVALGLAALMAGAFDFVKSQRGRGIEVESLAALPIHFGRLAGSWDGRPELRYGSIEFVGPWVDALATASMVVALLAFGWLLLWRLKARRWQESTPYDAAFAAVLLFTVTSRVISPQYLVWLVGLGALCLIGRDSCQRSLPWLLVPACALTFVEYPFAFHGVMHSRLDSVLLLTVRNLLLLTATVLACVRLWTATTGPAAATRGAERLPHRAGLG
jgi:Glycosyltransferase family 87